jgi:hypothetical protein
LSNPKANNEHESQTRVMDTIFKLINQEETVYLPLWEQISSDPRATFPMPGRLPLPIKSTGNDQHAQGMFTQFLQARKTSLSLIEHLYEQGWLDPSGAIDQNHQEKIKSLLGTMAEQDRLSLHQLNNL